MGDHSSNGEWVPGSSRVAVVMITLNEEHNMEEVLQNLKGWAQEVFVVDSYSKDRTVDIALRHGAHVCQRRFRGFGDQWAFALRELPIRASWTMKLDPDERISSQLKNSIEQATSTNYADGFEVRWALWFMGRRLPVVHQMLRIWRTGACQFTDVAVNEHPKVSGTISRLSGDLNHLDSPDLGHWLVKQNRYTSAEAIASYTASDLADKPRLFGTQLQRRMWIKRHFMKVPGRYILLFLAHYVLLGAWRAGWVGYAWSRLRADVYRLWEYKLREMRLTGRIPVAGVEGNGGPDLRVPQFD